ncbi:roquin-1 [Trichonephila inaurata madagascariensis]|uniref:RING-type E3 ubiquitin transferase n=1 Tax=Trichonephila inaurata madagascariensis TaxID=2747483 RepID=A0A8X6WRF9_9ARAC|nr:roquin-1 [Trichonephila inaurata madagascariensis]GFY71546.1 roquin-1 [Trichonephila inaurata madagascariensis]
MPIQAPQWTDFLSCQICYHGFESNVRSPISLGCGHTICKSCLSKLQRKQCPFDQTVINTDINQLPENYAILQLVGGPMPEKPTPVTPLVSEKDYKHYLEAKKYIEELALYLKSPSGVTKGILQCSQLSRPMQRKLVTLVNCQLVEEEGRSRGMRAARSLGERSVTELILQHQNPQQLSANLWAAVRARGCQFLGPAMQEEVLKLVLLALEDGSALSRKVLVMFVVQRLAPQFPQASKTSIGHVVQLLYRASCFKVSKREGDSSLMQLKDEFRTYEALRREHDAQVVQIATEAGLRIAPEQWSSLLYGDTAHKSHMQSIADKLQTPQSFAQSVQELVIALQRTGDPGNLSVLRPYLELLAGIDPSPDIPPPSWEALKNAEEAAKIVVKGLVDFIQNFGKSKLQDDRLNINAKYKTSMCRDLMQRRNCPRGLNCTFAHSQEELDKFRARSRRSAGGNQTFESSTKSPNPDDPNYGLNDDDLYACSSSIAINSYGTSSTPLASPDCGMSDYMYDGSYLSEASSSETEATVAENSSKTHSFSVQSNLCPSTNSAFHPVKHSPLQMSHKLNPESPAFQPLTTKLPLAPSVHSSYQILPNTIGVIPSAIAGLPATKVKLSSKSVSRPTVQNSSCFSTCDTSSISCSKPVCHANAIKSNASQPSNSVMKNQMDSQTLAALQKRKKQLLAQLDETNSPKSSCLTIAENGIVSSSDVGTDSVLKTVEDGSMVSFYSPWTSPSVFPYGSSTHCSSSDYNSSLNSYTEVNSSVAKEEIENGLLEMDFSNRALFCPSEKDEFIPFEPPLVSKYGPISRCSKSLIRATAPIQVNAVSHMGELTIPTSVVRHPLPSASFAPSFYATNSSGFAVPLAIIPEQYLPVVKSASVVFPVNIENSICLTNEAEMMRIGNAEAAEIYQIAEESTGDNLYHLQMKELLQENELNTQYLEEELWEIEKTIQEKEQNILRMEEFRHLKELNTQDLEKELMEIEKTIQEKEQNMLKVGGRYIDCPYKQKYDLKAGGSVPTSIGPWPSETLENTPLKPSEVLSGYQN